VKGRAFVVSRDLINSVRQENTVVLLLEDMQWTDFASWEYLMEVFLRETNRNLAHGIFILGAARPEWHPPEELTTLLESSSSGEISSGKWGSLISLAPLSSQETRDLALEILQRVEDVPEQVINLLVERSEGVPYFTEEIVNWFIDHEILNTHSEQWRFIPEKLKSQPLPSTLQHLLFTRLSSLSQPERSALQRGSIFGRRFGPAAWKPWGWSPGRDTWSPGATRLCSGTA
jgi:predicted ATPase